MQDFREVLASFDVAAWLSVHCNLRPSGFDNAMVNPCPLCGSNKGKFYINVGDGPKRGSWLSHCCHDEGGPLKLVMAVEQLSEIEARALIRLEAAERPLFVQAQLPQEAPKPLCDALPEPSWPAVESMSIMVGRQRRLLSDRLLTQPVIDRWGLKVTGSETTYGGERRWDLDHRLVLPVLDQDGQLLSWQARDLTGSKSKKYVFPANAAATNTLLGWQRGVTGSLGFLLIVEGFFHKVAWDRLGGAMAAATVASFGKKLTHAQIELLIASPAKDVLLGWDLDAIPEMCALAVKLYGRKRVWFVPSLADGRDHDQATPDELLQLMAGRQQATPALIAQLSAMAAMGHFRAKTDHGLLR